jgi:hypothetical protein
MGPSSWYGVPVPFVATNFLTHRLESPNSPQYLLDGVRLSTLLSAFLLLMLSTPMTEKKNFRADGGPPTENFSVHYDFETKKDLSKSRGR